MSNKLLAVIAIFFEVCSVLYLCIWWGLTFTEGNWVMLGLLSLGILIVLCLGIGTVKMLLAMIRWKKSKNQDSDELQTI